MSANIYNGTSGQLEPFAGRESVDYFEGTQAQWDALSSSEKAAYTGKYVYITDDEEEIVVETMSTDVVDLKIIKTGNVVQILNDSFAKADLTAGTDYVLSPLKYKPKTQTDMEGFIRYQVEGYLSVRTDGTLHIVPRANIASNSSMVINMTYICE